MAFSLPFPSAKVKCEAHLGGGQHEDLARGQISGLGDGLNLQIPSRVRSCRRLWYPCGRRHNSICSGYP